MRVVWQPQLFKHNSDLLAIAAQHTSGTGQHQIGVEPLSGSSKLKGLKHPKDSRCGQGIQLDFGWRHDSNRSC